VISVAIAYFNGDKFVNELLLSIEQQSRKVDEVVITVDSDEIDLKNIVFKMKWSFEIKIIYNKTILGFAKNFEKAISLCKHEYIFLADQDDVWCLDRVAESMDNIGDYDVLHSDCSLIDENGIVLKKQWKKNKVRKTYLELLYGNSVTGCTVLLKKSFFWKNYPLPEGLKFHDWYFGVLAARQNKLIYLNKQLVLYRQHENQQTVNRRLNVLEYKKILINLKVIKIHREDLNKVNEKIYDQDLYRAVVFFEKMKNGALCNNYDSIRSMFLFDDLGVAQLKYMFYALLFKIIR